MTNHFHFHSTDRGEINITVDPKLRWYVRGHRIGRWIGRLIYGAADV